MENKMIEVINDEIKWADKLYSSSCEEVHNERMARIFGMIQMLQIATGKQYLITKDGISERK